MPRARNRSPRSVAPARRRARGIRPGALLRRARAFGRAAAALPWRRVPLAGWVVLAVLTFGAVNACVQVALKPTELLGVAVPTAPKVPEATWAAYGHLFRAHATGVVPAELLAALAQAESAGDPLARTYWRWRWSWNPFELYAPASSAVGLLQITDGTYEQARRLCVHSGEVARDGPWLDPRTCWFNALYARWLPGDAVEMTAAWLHVGVLETLAAAGSAGASAAERRRLAAVIHLCGRGRGAGFVRRAFRPAAGERCGDHDLAAYLARVAALEATFARLAAR